LFLLRIILIYFFKGFWGFREQYVTVFWYFVQFMLLADRGQKANAFAADRLLCCEMCLLLSMPLPRRRHRLPAPTLRLVQTPAAPDQSLPRLAAAYADSLGLTDEASAAPLLQTVRLWVPLWQAAMGDALLVRAGEGHLHV